MRKFILDYERAEWKALRSSFGEDIEIQGCAFHWQQALMRHIAQLGLKKAYKEDIGTRDVLRKIMALCYIPTQYIPFQFQRLKLKCTTNALMQFAQYFEDTWLVSWKPKDWCVFNCSIRTNNTLEGHNFKFNSSCKENMPFYELVNKIFDESDSVERDIRLVYTDALTQRIDPTYATLNKELFEWWQCLIHGDMSVSDLVKKCARVYTL